MAHRYNPNSSSRVLVQDTLGGSEIYNRRQRSASRRPSKGQGGNLSSHGCNWPNRSYQEKDQHAPSYPDRGGDNNHWNGRNGGRNYQATHPVPNLTPDQSYDHGVYYNSVHVLNADQRYIADRTTYHQQQQQEYYPQHNYHEPYHPASINVTQLTTDVPEDNLDDSDQGLGDWNTCSSNPQTRILDLAEDDKNGHTHDNILPDFSILHHFASTVNSEEDVRNYLTTRNVNYANDLATDDSESESEAVKKGFNELLQALPTLSRSKNVKEIDILVGAIKRISNLRKVVGEPSPESGFGDEIPSFNFE